MRVYILPYVGPKSIITKELGCPCCLLVHGVPAAGYPNIGGHTPHQVPPFLYLMAVSQKINWLIKITGKKVLTINKSPLSLTAI